MASCTVQPGTAPFSVLAATRLATLHPRPRLCPVLQRLASHALLPAPEALGLELSAPPSVSRCHSPAHPRT